MSGGVDSSTAAFLMQQQGYDCAGCTMKLYTNEDAGLPEDGAAGTEGKSCCTLDDTEDARSVAFRLGMPFYVFNYTDEFRCRIIRDFAETYLQGQTPNPCINCNRYLKFGALLERARLLGYDKLVTGHYARIRFDGEKYHLLKGLDPAKDQSYVLYCLTQEQLACLDFPLGGLTKETVRQIAEAQGFINAHKRESQDICFVPDGDYARVIGAMTGSVPPPGDFVDLDGRVLGRHKGIIHYTIGQRKGLGLSLPAPLYVCRIDVEKNQVVLGPHEALFERKVTVRDVNWISGTVPQEPLSVQAKLRYRQPPAPATAYPLPDGSVRLVFEAPQRAVTPGQAAVLYDGEEVLGGGTIAAEPAGEKI
ncbi:MAG: tRNA 2-thiouridine(34) synthase MnmA [Lachnospiraceae bacterium]|nr:tRNA 2-thiouridine(34) synthase MnmA [Lachnospiraceae bacterium]